MTPREIKAARKALRLTQKQLAAVMGIGERGANTISEWERGIRNPGAQSIRLLQSYLRGDRPPDWPA